MALIKKIIILCLITSFAIALVSGCGSTDEKNNSGKKTYTSSKELSEGTIGVVTGSIFAELMEKSLPNATPEYFNSFGDCVAALEAEKIDAFFMDEPVIRYLMIQNKGLTYINEYIDSFDMAFALNKSERGEKIKSELDVYIKNIKADGTIEELQKKWFDGEKSSVESINYTRLPDKNGTIKVVMDQYEPFSMLKNEKFVGYEIDILSGFCKENGYALEIQQTNADAEVPMVVSGKADIIANAVSVTEERKEALLFSEPTLRSNTVLVVNNYDYKGSSFLNQLADSFEKTFIKEDRYKLFIKGILTTLLITALSIVFGTLLGILIYLGCRKQKKAAVIAATVFVKLINGLPVVVLLMIFYYIIFGSTDISGTIVSIIAFSLIFGSSVYSMISGGVNTLDVGQTEAAYALGYTDRKTLFKIIFPQALPHIMPNYKAQITELIKATSIVGYIAVQDLTKIGDIIRSRTYEAFFPLIAVAIIYFILAAILTFIVKRVEVNIDPKRRKRADILKNIQTM